MAVHAPATKKGLTGARISGFRGVYPKWSSGTSGAAHLEFSWDANNAVDVRRHAYFAFRVEQRRRHTVGVVYGMTEQEITTLNMDLLRHLFLYERQVVTESTAHRQKTRLHCVE